MSAAPATELVHRVRPAAGAPEGALVLLHGRGADEHDLFGVLDLLDPQQRLTGVTVRAPLSLPPGGRHWYAVPRVGAPDPATFLATAAQLCALLDRLPERLGVPWQHTVLGGFSQGGVMAYAMGLARRRPSPAGILALSSFLPEVRGHELDPGSRRGLPVAIAHGTLDPVIPVELARAARDRLREAGLAVTYWETAMGHTIDPRLLGDLQKWLAAALSAGGSPSTPTTSSAAEAGA